MAMKTIIKLSLISLLFSLPAGAQKPKEIEYMAHRQATIEAMDSLIKNAQEVPDILMKFADNKCKEFKNDTLLMSRLAEFFATKGGWPELAAQRFRELKKEHPKYLGGYFNYANTMHSVGTKVTPEGGLQRESKYRDLAKAQIDSAKAVDPKSIQPYLAWLAICAPFTFSEAVSTDFDTEVEAMNKAFPDSRAYYRAAQLLRSREPFVQGIEDSKTRADYEFLVDRKALDYYEKVNVETMTATELQGLSSHYYASTRSPYMDLQDKKALYEKGAGLALRGTEKFPDSIGFQRLLLWHNAELAKADDDQRVFYSQEAHQAAEKLFGSKENPIGADYFYDGLALQNMAKYTEAIDRYNQALADGLAYYDRNYRRDSVAALDNISDCYKALKDYDRAIAERKRQFEVRKAHKGELRLNDLQDLTSLYRSIANDTLNSAEKRIAAFVSADSLYAIIQDEIDKGNKNFHMPEGWTGYGLYNRYQMRLGAEKIQPDMEEFSKYEMAEAIIGRIGPLPEKSDREKGFLIASYDALRIYNFKSGNYKEALRMVEAVENMAPGTYEKRVIDTHRKMAKKR